MCFFNAPAPSPPPAPPPPAPPPPTPPPPAAPKPMEAAKPLTTDPAETAPVVAYGRKKSDDIGSRSSGASALRIPLTTGIDTSSPGGLSVKG